MALHNSRFRSLLSSSSFNQHLLYFAVDEAHCITQWGHNFRQAYKSLGSVRAAVVSEVPVLILSATMEPLVLTEVRDIMNISRDLSYHVNLGNRRENIHYEVHLIKKKEFSELDFVIPLALKNATSIAKTMIFFDDIDSMIQACERLQSRVEKRLGSSDCINFYHAKLSSLCKKRTLDEFGKGKIRVLLATEAAGMVRNLFNRRIYSYAFIGV